MQAQRASKDGCEPRPILRDAVQEDRLQLQIHSSAIETMSGMEMRTE
jgi:hypothetical protein